jgi:hypothetical protein
MLSTPLAPLPEFYRAASHQLELWLPTMEGISGCWQWPNNINSEGYGTVAFRGKRTKVHRAAFIYLRESIPSGMTLDHVCHNLDLSCAGGRTCLHRSCVNLDHIEPVTRAENASRMQRHRRARAALLVA